MKTQTFGCVTLDRADIISPQGREFGWAVERYKERRSNGGRDDPRDDPTAKCPDWREIPLSAYSWVSLEGTKLADVEWSNRDKDYFRLPDAAKYKNWYGYWEVTLRFDETPEMRRWMERRDVNYLTRLAREGRLYDAEPLWESEVSEWVLTEATKAAEVVEAMAAHGSSVHPAARAHAEELKRERQAAKEAAERQRRLAEKEQREKRKKSYRDKGLVACSQDGDLEAVTYLLSLAATDVNAHDASEKTALMYAVLGQHADMIALLLRHPAIQLDALSDEDRSALHYAASLGDARVVKALLGKGADPLLRDGLDKTPRDLAIASEHASVAALLRRAEEEAAKREPADTVMDETVAQHTELLNSRKPGAELAERTALEDAREAIAELDEQARQEIHAEFTRLQAELTTDRTASAQDKRLVSAWCDYTDPSKQVKLAPDKTVGRVEFSHLLKVGFDRIVLEMLTLSLGLLERRRDNWSKAGSFLTFIMGRLPILSTVAFFGEKVAKKHRDRKAAEFATKISSAWNHDLDAAVAWKREVVEQIATTYGELTPLQQQRLTVKQVQPLIDRLLAWSLDILYQRSDAGVFDPTSLVSGLLRKRALRRMERDRVLYKTAGVTVRLTDLLVNSGLCEHEPGRKSYYTETRADKDASSRCGFRQTEELGLYQVLGYTLQRTEGVRQRIADTGTPIDVLQALRLAEAEKARLEAELARYRADERAAGRAAASDTWRAAKPALPPRRTQPASRPTPDRAPSALTRAQPQPTTRAGSPKVEAALLESVKALIDGQHGFLLKKTTDTQLTLSDVSFRARKAEASVYAGAVQGLTDALSVYPDVEIKRQGTSALEITGDKKSIRSILGFFRKLTMHSEAKSEMSASEIKCAVM